MNNHRIRAIIFDLGNVLVDFDHRRAAERISLFCKKSPQEIFDLFFDSKLTRLFEEGRISARDFFLEVKAALDLQLAYREFVPIWNDIFFLTHKNHSVYNLAKTLKERYKTALLSNINVLHFAYLKQNFPVFDAFQYIVTSYAEKLRKPHPLIYHKTLRVLKVSPREVFYTDDRKELAESAKKLGINSFVFTSTEQLKKDLLRSGVNIN